MTRTDRQRWLLPSHLVEPGGSGAGRPRRTARLYMSVPTVKTCVSRLLAKLGLSNRVQTALLVHDAGLLDEDPDARTGE